MLNPQPLPSRLPGVSLMRSEGDPDPTDRAILQSRMALSAAVARWMGQNDLAEFVLPIHAFYFPAWWHPIEPEFVDFTAGLVARDFYYENGLRYDVHFLEPSPEFVSPGVEATCLPSVADHQTWRWPDDSNPGPAEYYYEWWDWDTLSGGLMKGPNGSFGVAPSAFCAYSGNMFIPVQNGSYGIDLNGVTRNEADLTRAIGAATDFVESLQATSKWAGANPLLRAMEGQPISGTEALPWNGPWDPLDLCPTANCNQKLRAFYESRALMVYPLRRYIKSGHNAAEVDTVALFDALELFCDASQPPEEYNWDCDNIPALQDVPSRSQLALAQTKLQCMANDFDSSVNRFMIKDLPEDAFRVLLNQDVLNAVSSAGGQYEQEVLSLRSQFLAASALKPQVASLLSTQARDLHKVDLLLEAAEAKNQLATLEYEAAFESMLATCMTVPTGLAWDNIPQLLNIVKDCGFAILASTRAAKVRRLSLQLSDIELERELLAFEDKAESNLLAMEQAIVALQQTAQDIRATLGRMEQIRQKAKVALAQALFLDGDETGRVFRSNTSLRRRYATGQVRYRRAKRAAIRLAYLAKLAIEQRFGVHLSEMTRDMTLVDAPATWESTVCAMSGIDYDNIRDSSVAVESFADEFIGDYVRNLELFVESYPYDFPFANAEDTAVVSLRDDIKLVREECPVPGANLLSWSNALDMKGAENVPGWSPLNASADAVTQAVERNAVAIEPWFVPEELPNAGSVDHGVPQPFTLVFGPQLPWSTDAQGAIDCGQTDCTTNVDCCSNSCCGWNENVAWGQVVSLPAGSYRLSWYGLPGGETDGATAVSVDGVTFDWAAPGSALIGPRPGGTAQWTRYWNVFQLPWAQDVVVRVMPSTAVRYPGQRVDAAGLMLEDISEIADGVTASDFPGVFEETDGEAMIVSRVCEDTDGDVFRAQHWRRKCVQLCDNGFTGGCDATASTTYCYRETEFTIAQEMIDRRMSFLQAGFAYGNYNYRIGSLALNFVGTGARQCADAKLPSTCYNAGFIPYSLEHVGPYEVRSADGNDFTAKLFTGRIEHARGLAAERYLTNPLSSADRSLIEPFYQPQLTGRPLTGTYRLRIWEGPSINFDGIEDIQILLNYRHWTRLD